MPPRTPTSNALPPTARRRPVAFVTHWLRLNWFDIFCLIAFAGNTFGIYHSPVPVTRTFPIIFGSTGDIVYPEWAYPYRGWIISSWASGVAAIGGSIIVYVTAQVRIRSIWDASSTIMGSIWAVLLASFFQVVIKQLIGGFRPYFLDVCMPDLSRAWNKNQTGLNAVGFQCVMFTIDVCTQPDSMKLKTAIKSFPSGHSTATWAGFGFLLLWMNAKLKVWADYSLAFWKLALTLLPLLVSIVIACTLTIDAAHNWYDIVAGSAIGAAMALAAYRASYAAVWDWRLNRIPLQPREPFSYGFDGEADPGKMFTRSAGWGSGHRPTPEMDSAMSSAVFERPQSDEMQTVEEDNENGRGHARTKRRPMAVEEAL